MEKIELEVMGITAGQIQSNVYALQLREVNGNRRVPIVIGAPEAQSIALRLEGIIPPRPLNHDLTTSVLHAFGIEMTEGLLVMTFDGCAISLFEGIGQELPRVEQTTWLGHIPGGKTIAVAKLDNLINTDVVIAAAEYLMDEVAHKGIITIASNFHSAFLGVNNLDIMRGVPCLRRGDEEAVVER